MTATDVLRRLLDERGVEHKDFFDQTWWEDSDGAAYTALETRPLYNNNPSTKLMIKLIATPEQAIAATLGSFNCSNDCTNGERTETCHMVLREDIRGHAYQDTYECSECGEYVVRETCMGESEPPNFCPNCGRKVVEPTTNDVGVEEDK